MPKWILSYDSITIFVATNFMCSLISLAIDENLLFKINFLIRQRSFLQTIQYENSY